MQPTVTSTVRTLFFTHDNTFRAGSQAGPAAPGCHQRPSWSTEMPPVFLRCHLQHLFFLLVVVRATQPSDVILISSGKNGKEERATELSPREVAMLYSRKTFPRKSSLHCIGLNIL